ncbi:gliding motility-associated C-terminal domain-containing protein [Myroides sp. DF42-4-2]|uniref:gliding motility-associated C-terminal domain-containing protein n=1 Tax=Myroides sp. DF42-4-2 TaxID=2746726 RepID=UPI002578D153|nr:gliding motility-associated C-terminal domain-containing protein [Myroides sp. DF42-4-2]MDM1408205.1 gliding motility-associated C-terminal domain-containing protein [Myroides sp. DF42-4-2]
MNQNCLKIILLLFCNVYYVSHAQVEEDKIELVNTGIFSVSPGTIVATEFDFINTSKGKFTNDGDIYFYKDFTNDGIYGMSSIHKTSSAYFVLNDETNAKLIKGKGLSSFYNIVFDSKLDGIAFDLKNNIDIQGLASFKNGIIKVDASKKSEEPLSMGMVSFLPNSKHENVGDHGFIDGEVEKIGYEPFEYPIGQGDYYRPIYISAITKKESTIVAQYYKDDFLFFNQHKETAGVIQDINNKEYWKISGSSVDEQSVVLSLSWDERTTLSDLLVKPEDNLHIVRWDAQQQLWVDEGGVVDMSSKIVTTPTHIKGSSYFTLATVKKDWILDGDIVIYNLVTPDGDGKNDYFIIDNINKYPNNTVEIYNRWGVKVYETKGYDPQGDGSSNVFRGYSEGRVTVDKNKKLPSGTYYYVVTYEYKDDNGSRMIKKAANLHLETN